MRDYLDTDRTANNIRLRRNENPDHSFLIVEGDTDIHFYQNVLDTYQKRCFVVKHLDGKNAKQDAIGLLAKLEKTQFEGVLAIVDADFDTLEGKTPESKNLFLTDTHDMETMILKSPAFDKFLSEYGSEGKIKLFVKQQNKAVRKKLLDEGMHLGYLRWISEEAKTEDKLKFDKLPFGKFVDKETLTVNQQKLLETIKNHSQQHALDWIDVKKRIEDKKDAKHNLWYVCCGHDLIELLSIGLRKALATRKGKEAEPEIIEKNLRLAYEYSYFVTTRLYRAIMQWEDANRPFKILGNSAQA